MTEAQFGQVVTQYERLVYTICYQLVRDHHTAEDLAQETFLSAYRHIDSCPEDSIKPWIARIATNKAKDHLKSAYNRKIRAAEDEEIRDSRNVMFMSDSLPEDITIENDTVAQISQHIENLKEPYRLVSIQYFLEEKSVDEIAKALDRPPKTVHTQLYRAKRILQEKLKGGT